ncbi:SIR2 family protein [Prescottella equi]|uniref:SIR2 family protein n=1 Tax=Rhodococcus hoagii TaxID=43767 RepID=UPI000A0FA6A8|nr:SIR2 family protein [Prescottella equi]
MSQHVEEIKAAVESRNALLVLGTGFTAASVEDPTNCSWPELLRSGVSYIKENGLGINVRIVDSILNDIAIGCDGDSEYLLTAAQKLVNAMGGTQSPHFAAYLKATIGRLAPDGSKSTLAEALESLGLPVVTTNYDTVYETLTSRKSVCWPDSRGARTAITSPDADSVFHLHGIWNQPDSVVITGPDYERIVSDANVKALRSSIGMLRTLIFVGFGAGLHDPHFSSLWRWLSSLTSGATHYSLCRSAELEAAGHGNHGTPIISVAYGEDYDDLAPFIASLAPKKKAAGAEDFEDPGVLARVRRVCTTVLLDRLTDNSPIIRHIRDDDRHIDELVVDPILLPVPPEQFAEEREKDGSEIERLDPQHEVRENDTITVVGEEQSGLTTTLIWMALKRSEYDDCIPVLLEYSNLPAGNKPVSNAVRKALRAASAPLKDSQSVPYEKICLVIDNVATSNNDRLTRVVDEISRLKPALVVYGCRPGVELRVQRAYSGSGSDAKPTYLGQFGLRHATELARRIHPEQAPRIAARVLSITRKERLSRTPLAIILLISGVAHDDGWINTVSNTSFIDSFVDSLLGRGKIRDDMHSQIDSAGYSRVLESVAMKMIRDDVALIELTDLIASISELVRTLDWSDSPDIVVRDLIAKGLLVDRSGFVRFRQSVYMHIFAARAAVKDRGILAGLLRRPLYYGAIIRHYAALKRDDEDLVKWAFDLIDKADDIEAIDSGFFGFIGSDEVDRRTSSIERLAEKLSLIGPDEQDGADGSSAIEASDPGVDAGIDVALSFGPDAGPASHGSEYDPYESYIVRDGSPFPASNLEDAPIDLKLSGIINLVSNILRDSELVENPNLKENLLKGTLSVWGRYMDIVNGSAELRSMIEELVDVIGSRLPIPSDRKDKIAKNLVDSWSMYEAYRGIGEELSTIKLRRALSRVAHNAENQKHIHVMIPAYLLDSMHDAEFWYGGFDGVLIENRNVTAVQVFVRSFVRTAYIDSQQNSRIFRALENFLVDFYLSHASAKVTNRVRGKLATRYRQSLRESWAKARAVESVDQRAIEAGSRT